MSPTAPFPYLPPRPFVEVPRFIVRREVMLVRLLLVVPVFASLIVSGGTTARVGQLLLVWTLTTILAAVRARRSVMTRDWATGLAFLDFLVVLSATLAAAPCLLYALPAYSLLGGLQALLWQRKGALIASLLGIGATLTAALGHAVPQTSGWSGLTLWAVYNTVAVWILGSYVEQQTRLMKSMECEAKRHAELAIRDPLTGLHNRRFLDQRLREEIARARRSGTPLALAVVDLDHLKRWNDQWGHAAGDAAIQATARLLQSACRAQDVVCRVGGEEFVLLAPDTDAAGLGALVDRVRAAAVRTVVKNESGPLPGTLSFSAGVAALRSHHAADGHDFVGEADRVLYAAKEAGRNRVMVARAA